MKRRVVEIRNGIATVKNSASERAKLYFYGDIASEKNERMEEAYPDTQCPANISKFFHELEEGEPVDIHINSGGGSVFGGLAIYNQIKSHNGPKTVYVDGIAASIASVIMMAGDEVIIGTGAQVMIHDPLCRAAGNAAELRRWADALDTAKESIIDVYMTKAAENVSREHLAELMSAETWMSGTAAAELFAVEVDNGMEAVACADSEFYDRYAKKPELNTPEPKPEPVDELAEEKEKLLLELDLI